MDKIGKKRSRPSSASMRTSYAGREVENLKGKKRAGKRKKVGSKTLGVRTAVTETSRDDIITFSKILTQFNRKNTPRDTKEAISALEQYVSEGKIIKGYSERLVSIPGRILSGNIKSENPIVDAAKFLYLMRRLVGWNASPKNQKIADKLKKLESELSKLANQLKGKQGERAKEIMKHLHDLQHPENYPVFKGDIPKMAKNASLEDYMFEMENKIYFVLSSLTTNEAKEFFKDYLSVLNEAIFTGEVTKGQLLHHRQILGSCLSVFKTWDVAKQQEFFDLIDLKGTLNALYEGGYFKEGLEYLSWAQENLANSAELTNLGGSKSLSYLKLANMYRDGIAAYAKSGKPFDEMGLKYVEGLKGLMAKLNEDTFKVHKNLYINPELPKIFKAIDDNLAKLQKKDPTNVNLIKARVGVLGLAKNEPSGKIWGDFLGIGPLGAKDRVFEMIDNIDPSDHQAVLNVITLCMDEGLYSAATKANEIGECLLKGLNDYPFDAGLAVKYFLVPATRNTLKSVILLKKAIWALQFGIRDEEGLLVSQPNKVLAENYNQILIRLIVDWELPELREEAFGLDENLKQVIKKEYAVNVLLEYSKEAKKALKDKERLLDTTIINLVLLKHRNFARGTEKDLKKAIAGLEKSPNLEEQLFVEEVKGMMSQIKGA